MYLKVLYQYLTCTLKYLKGHWLQYRRSTGTEFTAQVSHSYTQRRYTRNESGAAAVPSPLRLSSNLRYRCSSRIELGYRTIYMAPRLLHSQTHIRICSTCTRLRSVKYYTSTMHAGTVPEST